MVCISTYCIHTYANPTKLIIENFLIKKGTLYISYYKMKTNIKKSFLIRNNIRSSSSKHNIIGQFKTVLLSDHQSISKYQQPSIASASCHYRISASLNKNEKVWIKAGLEFQRTLLFSNNPSTSKGAPSFEK